MHIYDDVEHARRFHVFGAKAWLMAGFSPDMYLRLERFVNEFREGDKT